MKILFKLNQYNQQRQKEKKRWIFPILLASYATYLQNQGHKVVWDEDKVNSYDRIITSESQIDVPFLKLPHADRILTKAFDKKWQMNGNFKYLPATYIMAANSCWWKKCTFCVETKNNSTYEVSSVDDVIDEIHECASMGVKEIFDDSGTFPVGKWLEDFCMSLYECVKFSCNMRFGVLTKEEYSMMKNTGFRMLLYGLESANQKTLDKFNKGFKVEQVIPELKQASQVGLEPHICIIFGAPWETDQDAIRTLKLVWYLLKKGYAKTAQASFYDPPNQESLMHFANSLPKRGHKKYVKKIYDVWKSPQFWFRKLSEIKNVDDIKYLWRKIKSGLQS